MSELQPPDLPTNGETPAAAEPPTTHLTSKRQRRPSVRLGDIGDQPATLSYESYRRNKLWRDSRYQFYHHKDSKPSSRTRPLTNLGNGHQTLQTLEAASPAGKRTSRVRDSKGKRVSGAAPKRVRSTWVSSGYENDKFSGGDEELLLYRSGFSEESPREREPEQSPVQSMEDAPGVELDGRSENNDAREWKYGESVDRNGDSERGLEEGVRMWLNGLGLGRYEPVFEINEVDEEVLPLLTLEDLKDMGINAVGSRRKLYSAIQKLGRGFS